MFLLIYYFHILQHLAINFKPFARKKEVKFVIFMNYFYISANIKKISVYLRKTPRMPAPFNAVFMQKRAS